MEPVNILAVTLHPAWLALKCETHVYSFKEILILSGNDGNSASLSCARGLFFVGKRPRMGRWGMKGAQSAAMIDDCSLVSAAFPSR